MRRARGIDDPRIAGRDQAIEQQAGQREAPQVIDADMPLESIMGFGSGHQNRRRVVHQQVQALETCMEICGKLLDRCQVRLVHYHGFDMGVGYLTFNFPDRDFGLGRVAYRHDDMGSRKGQGGADLQAEPAIGAGDDGQLAALRRNVSDRPFARHHLPPHSYFSYSTRLFRS
jgi:hypothetical protein